MTLDEFVSSKQDNKTQKQTYKIETLLSCSAKDVPFLPKTKQKKMNMWFISIWKLTWKVFLLPICWRGKERTCFVWLTPVSQLVYKKISFFYDICLNSEQEKNMCRRVWYLVVIFTLMSFTQEAVVLIDGGWLVGSCWWCLVIIFIHILTVSQDYGVIQFLLITH